MGVKFNKFKLTLGNIVNRLFTDVGVENMLDRIIFSSKTLCSFKTVTAVLAVFPVPEKKEVYLNNLVKLT